MRLSQQPSFQFWIRRSGDASDPFALKFRVSHGKGLLRVAHPDVLLDPPAAEEGQQESLSAEVVRASRFLLVSDGGRSRKGFFLAALGDAFLDRLPLDIWVELSPRVAGDMRLLVPRTRLPGMVSSDVPPSDSEPEDLVTNPRDRPVSQLGRVRDVLSGFTIRPSAPTGAATKEQEAPVVKERSWGDGEVSLFDFSDEHTDPSIGDDPIFIGGGSEEEARALVGHALLASASMFDAPPASQKVGETAETPAEEASPAVSEAIADHDPTSAPESPVGSSVQDAPDVSFASGVDVPTQPDEPPVAVEEQHLASRPRIALSQLPIGPQRTALLRHMRRSAVRDHDQLELLKARVAELEAQLAEARSKLEGS